MSKLPTAVAALFAAINQKSLDSFMKTFASDALLIDEGRNYTDHKSIQKWCKEALISHNASVEIHKTVLDLTDHIVVHTIMDGDFEADYGITEPFTLYFEFHLKNQSTIQRLLITPWDSSKPSMMAVYVDTPNEADPLSAIKISPRPQQTPPAGWVKVKMQAVGLNYHDIFTARGQGMHPLKFPLILGCEGAGVLEDGTEVLLYPVMSDAGLTGDETTLLDPKRHVPSELTNGSMAEYVNVPRSNVVVRPKELDVEAAAVLGIAWLTAYRMLFTKSGLRAGQTMLVQGSSGGVATALIQMGAAAGMRVWCTGRTVAKRELGLKLGAERVFEAGEELPEKVDAVFDLSGEVTWEHTLNSLRTGGTIVSGGGHGGMSVSTDAARLLIGQWNIRGSYLGTLQEFRDLISLVVLKGIKPHVGLVLPMDQAVDGLRKMLSGETEGKIVVKV